MMRSSFEKTKYLNICSQYSLFVHENEFLFMNIGICSKGVVYLNQLPEVMKLVEAGLKEDSSKVLSYTNLLINKLEKNGEVKAANRFKNIIKQNRTISLKEKQPTLKMKSPVDSESRLPLAEIEQYAEDSVFLSVSEQLLEDINEFICLIKKTDELTEENLQINRSLLMYGQPGTGKTQAAKYISAKTNLPLVTVRIDGMVSSYLGSTSKNIRTLFDFVEKTPCILFLDEFDAIAKMRDDSNELGELKRVVNALLQNIDSIHGKLPILAATNHQHMLDPAVWRRFDYKLIFNLPTEKERESLIREFLKPNKIAEKPLKILVEMTDGLSGADIEILGNTIRTNIFLNKIDNLNETAVFDSFLKYQSRSITSNNVDKKDTEEHKILLAKSLRNRNKKMFDIRTLSKMLGCSTGKTSMIMKEGN
jgi:SpoVK/Ycf46/Vps4 family AAA+-type ATPase